MDNNFQILLHTKIIKSEFNRKLIIFGTGSGAIKTIVNLGPLFEKVEYFIDNNVDDNNKDFYGRPVFSPDILKKEYKENIFILVASSFYENIFKQLEELGFNQEQHYIQTATPKLQIDESTTFNRVVNGVKVGKYTYGYKQHCFTGTLLKEIGSFCSINESVKIGVVNHPTDLITTHPLLYMSKDEISGYEGVPGLLDKSQVINLYEYEKNKEIIIGNDVWIGTNVVVLPGVKIGDGSIIGAGAVVTKDIPDYSVVIGVPAKVIKYRFTKKEILILKKVKWWEWSNEEIIENVDLLKNPELFFARFNN